MFDRYVEMGSGRSNKNIWKVLLIILLISIVITVGYASYQGIIVRWNVPECFNIITLPGTNMGTNYVTLNGEVTAIDTPSATVWFEYGMISGVYLYRTPNQTVTSTGSFNRTIRGIQLIPGKTYYYRAVGTASPEIYGDIENFTLNVLTPIPTQDFGEHYEELEEAKFNLSKLAVVIPKTFTDIMGNLFFGLLFALIFLGIWLRQEDVGIPALLGMLVGGSIWFLLPEEFVKISYSLLVVSLGALVYSLIKGRK